jgi:hypothetical protein
MRPCSASITCRSSGGWIQLPLASTLLKGESGERVRDSRLASGFAGGQHEDLPLASDQVKDLLWLLGHHPGQVRGQ